MQNEYPKACFDHAVYHEFEGLMMPLPADYDTYLKMAFGNYMELPPADKRNKHDSRVVWIAPELLETDGE